MQSFLDALRTQRWDDHRYYHHSRINQSLHLISAMSFLAAYLTIFTNPAASGFIGWLFAMMSRQAGHFFFEPKGYDVVNQASHEYKEQIKVGYNLRRKIVLIAIWAQFSLHIGQLWLAIGLGGLMFRTIQLFFIKDVQTGLVWLAKIITDPFHDILLYYRAPLYLLRGEVIDPMAHAHAEAQPE
jgi:hypothetical protein